MGDPAAKPTNVRFLIVIVTSLTAIFMYVDRGCIAQLKGVIGKDLDISDQGMDWIMSAFFWSYALAQVPSGFVGSRFGMRKTLAIMLFSWSVCTAVCGLATGFAAMFASRLAVGVTEAGAYPSAAAIVKGWFPISARGRANSFVALGGRLGFVLSQILTPWIAGYPFFGWRGALILYGILGMFWAFVFWWLVRDKAKLHPWSNQAEVDYAGTVPVASQTSETWPVMALLSSRNMWFFGLTQFGSNVGWAFLITNLPAMLENYLECDNPSDRGWIAAMPPAASCLGMFLGGFVGDWCVRRFGLLWGRRLPISLMLILAALAYLTCIMITSPMMAESRSMIRIQDAWLMGIVLACMAICQDIGIPSVWAFSQDVGGKHVGATLGFGNMIGNLGAAASPLLLGFVQRNYGYNNMFLMCAGFFLLASFCALNLNATKPVLDD
ncbi:MFS transporter [Zavarzinella formosa]|uniref:MFS transporter n=1 Tax=Zavarzinella formosa TaxID=360055 RepID=UPI0012F914A5|nr:MFS transporter [Zavarzinella formosa]